MILDLMDDNYVVLVEIIEVLYGFYFSSLGREAKFGLAHHCILSKVYLIGK